MKVVAQGTFDMASELADWAVVAIDYQNYPVPIPDMGFADGGAAYTDNEIKIILKQDAREKAGFGPNQATIKKLSDLFLVVGQREKPLWSREWPTEPGKYWFYGLSSPEHVNPSMILIDVRKDWYAVANTTIPIRKERALGLWTPAFLPNVPDLSEITEEKR